MITVFTATYNRGAYLERLYQSLLLQTDKNFEWIVIDDASDDDTTINMRRIMKNDNGFPIYFYHQKHGGKHRAINHALDVAKGDYFFIVDSDDYLTENAIALVLHWISTVDDERIAGVSGLKIQINGEVCGGNPLIGDEPYIDASNFERQKWNLLGDKAEVYRTDLLRKYRFPMFKNENFVTEDVCWNAIANEGYKVRWFKEPIYMCEYLQQGLTKSGANGQKGHIDNYKGYCYYVNRILSYQGISFWEKVAVFGEFERIAHMLKLDGKQSAYNLRMHIFDYMKWRIILKLILIYRKHKNRILVLKREELRLC